MRKRNPMPLSEDEQRIHDQIEAQFYANDPQLAQQVSETTLYRHASRNIWWAALGFVLGLVVLLTSFASKLILGFVGFLAMLGGTMLAISARGAAKSAGGSDDKQAEPDKNRFTGRMEERFRRRFEQD